MNSLTDIARTAALAVLGTAASLSAQAQTYAELKAAVAAAADGETVHVTSDMTFDSELVVDSGKSITVEGWDADGGTGRVWTLTRSLDYAEGAFFRADSGTRSMTLKNVVLDLQCNKRARQLTRRVIQVTAGNCRFTLGSGAKICNVYQTGDYPGTMYAGTSGTVVMEAGSEISDCYCYAYGAAVQVGRGNLGVFIMNGGLITDCHGPDGGEGRDDWGAAVHVYGGQFKFNGGLITGNTSPHHTGGVLLYRGSTVESSNGMMFCGGSGAITGNVGQVANDVYCKDNKSNVWIVNQTYVGDTAYYKGAVLTVRCGDTAPAEGDVCKAVIRQASSDNVAFAKADVANVSLQDDPTLVLDPTNFPADGDGKYTTTWRRKIADVVVNGAFHAKFTVKDVWSAINGKKAVASFWRDFEFDTADCQPVFVTNCLNFAGDSDVIIRSVGERRRFSMPANSTQRFMFLSQPAAGHPKRVRFENLIIDGNSQNGAISPGGGTAFIWIQRDCALEFGPGATLCNVYNPSNRSGIVAVSKSRLVLEEGAVISNVVAGTWSSAILIGSSSTTADPTVFDMSGGLITACDTRGGGVPSDGNGGAVTIWRAQMNMSGGRITGNRATDNTNAGVLLHKSYNGELNLSGDARICDNPGKHPDLFIGRDGVHYSGDFRGLVGVDDSSLSLNVNPGSGATGAWCFYKSSNTAANHRKYWGYVDGGTFKWGEPTGWIDEWGFVQASDVDVRLADPEDLSTPEAIAKLPHVLSGSALAGTISQTFTFGAQAMCESGRLPLCLYTFQNGDFTGRLNLTTPVEGSFSLHAGKRTVDDVPGLYLIRTVPGLVIKFL